MTETALQPLPLGTSDFVALRKANQIYVDKTALIHQLACRRRKVFLTRPRRFGKSLLVSTFATLFRDGLKSFSGLAIEKLWKDATYPVVEIDFSKVRGFENFEDFENKVRSVTAGSFARAGFVLDKRDESNWIRQISDWMQARPANSLVLLIDEYDAPYTASLEDKVLLTQIRECLSAFYAVIESNDACLRFAFMTGIIKFSQYGDFEELNNFTDISLDPAFGALAGFTDEDILRDFSGYLRRAGEALGMSPAEVHGALREHYDGYCFDDEASQHVYAPWSVLNFFSRPSRGFLNYWVRSGGAMTGLLKYLRSDILKAPSEYAKPQWVTYADLKGSTDFDRINDLTLLMQAGYLTIKTRRGNSFRLGYPNKEVAVSLAELYCGKLLDNRDLAAVEADTIVPALLEGDVKNLFESVNRAFAALHYAKYPIAEEKSVQSCLQVFLAGAGFAVRCDTGGALDRSGLEVDAGKVHWVIELKFQRKRDSAVALLEDAARQIRDRNYGATSSQPLIRAAAVFSEEKRAFVCWKNADTE